MSGITPLNNTVLKSALNINGADLLNSTYVRGYVNYPLGSDSVTIDAGHMGRFITYGGGPINLTLNADLSGVSVGDTFLVCATNGVVYYSGSANIEDSFQDVASSGSVYQLIYLGYAWLIINNN